LHPIARVERESTVHGNKGGPAIDKSCGIEKAGVLNEIVHRPNSGIPTKREISI
jgi:hypothetical protein